MPAPQSEQTHMSPNPLEPASLCGHDHGCSCTVPSNAVSVHNKLLNAPFANGKEPHELETEIEPPSKGEISTAAGKHVYETLALSSTMFSKHLQTEKKKVDVKTILTVMKHHVGGLAQKNRELAEWLLGKGFTVIVEMFLQEDKAFDAEGLLAKNSEWKERLKFWAVDVCKHDVDNIDLIVTLGGDGTVLYSSFMFQQVVPPVVSFALGSFGFLTRLDFANYRETLQSIFEDGIKVCLRTRLAVRFMRSVDIGIPASERTLKDELLGSRRHEKTHELVEEYVALNEIVVDRGSGLTVSNTELFSLEEHITAVTADGIMVSTPTGSTAYNLAAGGPLCHPDMSAIVVTPICPHSLTFRPVVLPDFMVLRLGVPYDAINSSSVKVDGRTNIELKRGDYIQINVSRFPFAVVQTEAGCDREWFQSIEHSFLWGSKRQTAADGLGK